MHKAELGTQRLCLMQDMTVVGEACRPTVCYSTACLASQRPSLLACQLASQLQLMKLTLELILETSIDKEALDLDDLETRLKIAVVMTT